MIKFKNYLTSYNIVNFYTNFIFVRRSHVRI
nr:MAG TPA: hypothetical protein [Caudoviricetes sp.]